MNNMASEFFLLFFIRDFTLDQGVVINDLLALVFRLVVLVLVKQFFHHAKYGHLVDSLSNNTAKN